MNGLPVGKPAILVIDDDLAVRSLLYDLLSDDYYCETAASAEEGLSAVKEKRFNLVISDINLGGMSGVDMIPCIREVYPDTVVMMISGANTIDSAVDAMRVGSFDYLKKPFQIEHVIAAVGRALEHQALVAAKREHEQELERLVEERTARVNYLEYHDVLT